MNYDTDEIIVSALRSKIQIEEETLIMLREIEIFAEDITEHNQIVLMQERIVNFYKDIFAKVNLCTNLH